MAISNEWQNVQLNRITIRDIGDTLDAYIFDGESVQRIADAMGWECVQLTQNLKFKAYSSSLDWTEFPASEIYAIRPIDQEYNYGIGVIPMLYIAGRSYFTFVTVTLSSGYSVTYIGFSNAPDNNIMILRPSAQGCMGLRMFRSGNTLVTVAIDKFTNPKTDAVKWGMLSNSQMASTSNYGYFVDIYTGALIGVTNSSGVTYNLLSPDENFYPYVALKKMTVISADGIYVARTLYQSFIDYTDGTKTIEIDGSRYICIGAYRSYIPLE